MVKREVLQIRYERGCFFTRLLQSGKGSRTGTISVSLLSLPSSLLGRPITDKCQQITVLVSGM